MKTFEVNVKAVRHLLGLEITLSKSSLKVMGVGVFVFLTAIGAYIRVPLFFTPVPLTMQTLFVLLSGAILKKKYGSISQMLYVALGALGLPLFAGAVSGSGIILGPTGGYLMGFILASFVLGVLLDKRERSLFGLIISFVFVSILILTLGSLWLKVFLGVGIKQAFMIGFLPFIAGDILKCLLAATVYDKLKHKF